jgi:hypothetical protein
MAAWEALEARQLMSVTPGWSEAVNGFTLSYDHMYPEDPTSLGTVTVTGTVGDDVMRVFPDPSGPNRLGLELNGASYSLDLGGMTAGVQQVLLDGGAGNDRLVSTVAYTSVNVFGWWGVTLNGGDGNDFLSGGSAGHSLNGGAGDDVLVGGDGRNFMNGNDGDDTLFGHGYALDGHGADPTYDLLNGGAGDDVVHGGAMGWAVAGEGDDLVFDGYAADFGTHLRVQGADPSVPVSYTAGDPLLAGAPEATATLVGRVLVITGTAGDDAVSVAVTDGNSATLSVTVNGTTQIFSRSTVRAFVFDSRGGHDAVEVGSDVTPLNLAGWVVRTANPDDSVGVIRHSSDDFRSASGDAQVATLNAAADAEAEARAARRAERKARAEARRAERLARRAEKRLWHQMRKAARQQARDESSGDSVVFVPTSGLFSTVLIGQAAPRGNDDVLALLA